MIRMDDGRIKNQNGLLMCCLFLLNQQTGLKLNPAKIDIYYEQLKGLGFIDEEGNISLEDIFKFFGAIITIKSETPSYKLKKNEHSIVNYEDESTYKNQYVVGVGPIVCYNPVGNVLKGKPSEAIVIKFK